MPNAPVEKQPQLITSPDNKLQIISHAAAGDMFGCYTTKGVIKNISSEADVNVEIKVEYYDINGEKMDTEVDTFYIPFPGGSRAFHIIYPGSRYDDVKAYRIYPTAKDA